MARRRAGGQRRKEYHTIVPKASDDTIDQERLRSREDAEKQRLRDRAEAERRRLQEREAAERSE